MIRWLRDWLRRDHPPTLPDTIVRAALASVPFGGAAEVVFSDARERYADRARQTLGDILDVTGDDVLARRLAENADLDALFVQGVNAALSTGMEAKRRLLARAISAAVVDDDRLDESWLLTDVLAHLDVPHVRALDAMTREWDATKDPEPGEVNRGVSEVWRGLRAPIRAALIRTGTAFGPNGPGVVRRTARSERNRQEGITDFGIAVIADLRREGYSETGEV